MNECIKDPISVIYYVCKLPSKKHKLKTNITFWNEGFEYRTYTKLQRQGSQDSINIKHIITYGIHKHFQKIALILMATPTSMLLDDVSKSAQGYQRLINAIENLNIKISEDEDDRQRIFCIAISINDICIPFDQMKEFISTNSIVQKNYNKLQIITCIQKILDIHIHMCITKIELLMLARIWNDILNFNKQNVYLLEQDIEENIL